MVNSAAFSPATAIALTVPASVPLLISVNTAGAELAPTAISPKECDRGESAKSDEAEAPSRVMLSIFQLFILSVSCPEASKRMRVWLPCRLPSSKVKSCQSMSPVLEYSASCI